MIAFCRGLVNGHVRVIPAPTGNGRQVHPPRRPIVQHVMETRGGSKRIAARMFTVKDRIVLLGRDLHKRFVERDARIVARQFPPPNKAHRPPMRAVPTSSPFCKLALEQPPCAAAMPDFFRRRFCSA